MGALYRWEEEIVSLAEREAWRVSIEQVRKMAALVRRLAGRVEDTGAALFRAENDISNALCSLRANDHQTREILESARMRIWVARGIELPAPTAPREAARICKRCGYYCVPPICTKCATPTESPSTVKPPTNSGTNSESTGAKCPPINLADMTTWRRFDADGNCETCGRADREHEGAVIPGTTPTSEESDE